MTFAAVTKNIKKDIVAAILNYSDKREKRKLIYFSERKKNETIRRAETDDSRFTETE